MSLRFKKLVERYWNRTKALLVYREALVVKCFFIILYLGLASKGFRLVPDTLDETEYATNVRTMFLPHAPYYTHYLLGKLFATLVDPAMALSFVSLVSAGIAIVYFFKLVRVMLEKIAPDLPNRKIIPWIATIFFAASRAIADQSGGQEVYIVQVGFTIASFYYLFCARFWLGGILFGLAFCTHNAGMFLFPAAAYAVWLVSRRDSALGSLARFLASSALVILGIYGLFYLLIYVPDGMTRVDVYRQYIGGQPTPNIWAAAVHPLAWIVTTVRYIIENREHFNGALGYGPYYTALGLVSCLAFLLRSPRFSMFWIVFAFPYFMFFESLHGWKKMDGWLYTVYLQPALAMCAALPFGVFFRADTKLKFAMSAACLCLCASVLLEPFLNLTAAPGHVRRWREQFVGHHSPTILSAMYLNSILPKGSIIILPRDGNYNRFRYYFPDHATVIPYFDYLDTLEEGAIQGTFALHGIIPHRQTDDERLANLLEKYSTIYHFTPNPFAGIANIDARKYSSVSQEISVDRDALIKLLPIRSFAKRIAIPETITLYELRINPVSL